MIRDRARRGRALRDAALILLVSGCGGSADRHSAGTFNPGPPPAALVQGEHLFNANCATCHGALGAGSVQGPPLVNIIYQPSHHADESFRRAILLGSPQHHWNFGPMPPVRMVTRQQAEPIILYVRWLQQQAGIR